MTTLTIRRAHALKGTVTVPSDKSISHRALIFGALAGGKNIVRNWLNAGDTRATLGAVRALGIQVDQDGNTLTFEGAPLRKPDQPIDCINAGTAMRLLAGLMSAQGFDSILDGSEQLRRRPMRRVTEPLQKLGARIEDTDGRAPLHIGAARLQGNEITVPVASAQVKSAVILAGLHADGATRISEPSLSRDHTERMLSSMGADIQSVNAHIEVSPLTERLRPLDITVPGDMSSAAFLIVAAAVVPESDIRIEGVNLNPTRTGLYDALNRMGAGIEVEDAADQAGEPAGTLRIKSSALSAGRMDGAEIAWAIDEIPALAVAATQAHGETTISDAAELRVKEVDRINLLVTELRKLGAHIDEKPAGILISGPTALRGAVVDSHGDHRLGMALAVAGLIAEGETVVQNAECISDSFPGFAETLAKLGADVRL